MDSDHASVALVEDTAGSRFALVVFEKGGKINDVHTVHVLAHFDPLTMEHGDREKHWAALISTLFPADYPVLAADVQLHSCVPGRVPPLPKPRLLCSGLMAVMDFVYLSLAGEQVPTNKRPDYNLCFRTLLSEVAGLSATALRFNVGPRCSAFLPTSSAVSTSLIPTAWPRNS